MRRTVRTGSTTRSRSTRLAVVAVVVLAGVGVVACSSESSRSSGAASGGSSSSAPASSTTVARPDCTVTGVAAPVAATSVPGSTNDGDLVSFDGTKIRTHWFPLPAATAKDPKPTVLMGPGWSLAGDSDPDAVGALGAVSIKSLNDAGFNVLTWDPRGFGASGGAAQVDSKESEGRDVQQLLQWVSEQPGVQLDAPGDPRVGMVGGSYGGGIQLVTAGIDCRVDAIVPIIAWNSLGTSLFKAETVKQGWAGVLTKASASANVDPVVSDSYQQGLDTGTITDAQRDWFLARGPGDLLDAITVPTLIIQGTVDTLFTLDEGVANYAVLRGNGVPVAMMWFCGGHGICLTDPGDTARVERASIAWLQHFVAGDASVELGPRVDIVDQKGVRYTAADLPAPTGSLTGTGSGTLQLTADGGAGPVTETPGGKDLVGGLAQSITPARATNAVDVAVKVETGPQLVLGAPQLKLKYSGSVPAGERPTRVFAQLVDDSNGVVVGNQITPVPLILDGAVHDVSVPMETVAFTAATGSSITLQLVPTTVAYAQPRLGGQVDFQKIDVSLPVVTGMKRRG